MAANLSNVDERSTASQVLNTSADNEVMISCILRRDEEHVLCEKLVKEDTQGIGIMIYSQTRFTAPHTARNNN